MTIIYTAKAKEDLARINWRTREDIINQIAKLERERIYEQIYNSDFQKIHLDSHVVIGKLNENNFSVITVVERKKIKVPEQV
jgi:hypothetical protein